MISKTEKNIVYCLKRRKKKLIDCCIGYKACKRNNVGNDPRFDSEVPQLFFLLLLLFLLFAFFLSFFSSQTLKLFPCMAIYRKMPFGAGEARPGEWLA